MKQACPNPSCDAVYTITPDMAGRRLSCSKCGSAFTVGDSAPRSSFPPPPPPDEGIAPRARRALRLPAGLPDLPTCLFAAGTFLAILYMFLPQIAQASVAGKEARIVAGELRWKRTDAEFKALAKPGEDDKERHQQAKERWEKRKRQLEEDAESAEESRRVGGWWHRWGMMLGLLLLAAGSFGYLDPAQPPMRRIMGSVVLLALLVCIISAFVGFGIRFDVGPR